MCSQDLMWSQLVVSLKFPHQSKPAHNLQQDMSELNKTVKNIWIRCHLAITCKLKLLKIYAWLN